MSSVAEKYIQERALRFLKEFYKEEYNLENVHPHVKGSACKYHESDDFLQSQKKYKERLKSKPSHPFNNIRNYWKEARFANLAIFIALMAGVLSLYFTQEMFWYYRSLFFWTSVLLIFGLVLGGLAVFTSSSYKFLDFAIQIHLYPTDEKWIAISKESLNLPYKLGLLAFYKPRDCKRFLQACQSKEVGVLVISKRKTKIIYRPKL